MADDKRARGARRMEDVCGIPAPPAGVSRFLDMTVEHLFADIWDDAVLSVRDRRLVVLGILAALGDAQNLGVHATQALRRGDVTPEQLDEVVLTVAHYAGWPRSTLALAAAGTAKAAHAQARET